VSYREVQHRQSSANQPIFLLIRQSLQAFQPWNYKMLIRHCQEKDIPTICKIYNYYIANTIVTFEEMAIDASTVQRRIESTTQQYPWLVCEIDGVVTGYAHISQWKEKSAFKKSVESTVYVDINLGGKGYGKALYSALLDLLGELDCHVVVGAISLPNEASIGLHEYFGFKKVGHFFEVGFKFGQWVDVGYWQKIIELKGTVIEK